MINNGMVIHSSSKQTMWKEIIKGAKRFIWKMADKTMYECGCMCFKARILWLPYKDFKKLRKQTVKLRKIHTICTNEF